MINWNDVWKHQMLTLKRRSVTLQTEFWDNTANRKNEDMLSMADLTDKQLESIKLDPEDTLLEIGPGYGRLAIPLAKIVKAVTAIEPSRKMLLPSLNIGYRASNLSKGKYSLVRGWVYLRNLLKEVFFF